jgi:hypothetical protein
VDIQVVTDDDDDDDAGSDVGGVKNDDEMNIF